MKHDQERIPQDEVNGGIAIEDMSHELLGSFGWRLPWVTGSVGHNE